MINKFDIIIFKLFHYTTKRAKEWQYEYLLGHLNEWYDDYSQIEGGRPYSFEFYVSIRMSHASSLHELFLSGNSILPSGNPLADIFVHTYYRIIDTIEYIRTGK